VGKQFYRLPTIFNKAGGQKSAAHPTRLSLYEPRITCNERLNAELRGAERHLERWVSQLHIEVRRFLSCELVYQIYRMDKRYE
jgi:hypothetical protein